MVSVGRWGKLLYDEVGKDFARSIMEGEGKDGTIFDANKDLPAKVIEGEGLRIGAEGMKGFYDQILPRFMDKYGKKWGVKTGEVELLNLEEAGRTMWAVDVTDEMRESVMEGQGMFSKMKEDDVEEINRRFNEQLEGLTEESADRVVLFLGRPSVVLLAAGVEDKPMKLYGNKVMAKIRKHGFTLLELQDLPLAVAKPIAVFNNYGIDGNRAILTELHTEQGNILVTVTLGKGGLDIDFNIISSVFGKSDSNVVNWINKGYATYINKEKALDYLHHSAPIAEALSSPRLISAAKIVEDFENPKLSSENFEENSEEESEREVAYEISEFQPEKGFGLLKNVESANISVGGRKIGRVFKTEDGYYAETNLMDFATEMFDTAEEAVENLIANTEEDPVGESTSRFSTGRSTTASSSSSSTFFFVFLGCAARPKAVLRRWNKGCQACLDRTWGDALEQMLAEHAAQTRVFMVLIEMAHCS